MIKNELEILVKLDHPNILKMYAVYEDNIYLHMVTELCEGGDLIESIISRGNFPEQDVAETMSKLISAVNHMQDCKVVHRDLKGDNILLTSSGDKPDYKIIDFGLGCFFTDAKLTEITGTPAYIAPEVIDQNYNKECDMWSLGVIMYAMLGGNMPFYEYDTIEMTFNGIKREDPDYKSHPWPSISEKAKNLVKRMLTKNPAKRITPSEALDHAFFNAFEVPNLVPTKSTKVKIGETLKRLKKTK